MKRILLVEDEKNLQRLIKFNLEREGYEVVVSDDGLVTLNIIAEQHFDLVILDIMLPGLNGFRICEKMRQVDQDTPVIIVSAKNTAHDRIKGLKTGADDYLSKPFNLEELLLRIQKLISRSEITSSEIQHYEFGENTVNFKSFEAHGVNGDFLLTAKEAMLLKMLIDRKNVVVTRQQILQTVWGYDVFPSTRTIDNFIVALRKHFEKDPRKPQFITSVRGMGYKFIDHTN